MASGPNTKSSMDRLLSDALTRITLLERRAGVQPERLSTTGALVPTCGDALAVGFYRVVNAPDAPMTTSLGSLLVRRAAAGAEAIQQEFRRIYIDSGNQDARAWIRASMDSGATWSPWEYVGLAIGSTSQRDQAYGAPATVAEQVALANQQVWWYNTTTNRRETYYAVSGSAGLIVPGLHTSGFSAGWYVAPSYDWGSQGGPSSISAAYRTIWAKGLDAGSVIDAHSATDGIIIGMSGVYECIAVQRGGPSSTSGSDYIGLAINGDRAAMETRATGMWTHDHSAGSNLFSNSRYIGPLVAGEKITAGAPSTTNAMLYGSETHRGMMQIRRIS